MRAVVCTRYGETDAVVELRDMPQPEVLAHDVLIEVHAASVNPVDFKIQQGAMKAIRKLSFPFIMGFDVSGVVVATGAASTQFKAGDEVFSRVDSQRFGTFAEFVAVDEKFVARKPASVSHREAAALPLAALTSWQALNNVAKVKPGQRVLIHAGAGGVGSLAIQLAKQLGAEVTATTSTKNIAMVRALGADAVVDYTQQMFEKVLKDFDVVFETLGGENQEKSFGVLKEGGVLVSVLGIPTGAWAREEGLPVFMVWLFDLLNWKNRRLAKKHKVRFEHVMLRPDGRDLTVIATFVADGKVRPVVDKVFPLERAKEALKYLQTGRARGKVVIDVK